MLKGVLKRRRKGCEQLSALVRQNGPTGKLLASRRRAKVNGTQALSFHVWSLVVLLYSILGFCQGLQTRQSLGSREFQKERKKKRWLQNERVDGHGLI